MFEEYAAVLFAQLRGRWLGCDAVSDTYVKALFGEADAAVEALDINKSCKDY